MLNVKNFIQSKALGVAEYMTPILKVNIKNYVLCYEVNTWIMLLWLLNLLFHVFKIFSGV